MITFSTAGLSPWLITLRIEHRPHGIRRFYSGIYGKLIDSRILPPANTCRPMGSMLSSGFEEVFSWDLCPIMKERWYFKYFVEMCSVLRILEQEWDSFPYSNHSSKLCGYQLYPDPPQVQEFSCQFLEAKRKRLGAVWDMKEWGIRQPNSSWEAGTGMQKNCLWAEVPIPEHTPPCPSGLHTPNSNSKRHCGELFASYSKFQELQCIALSPRWGNLWVQTLSCCSAWVTRQLAPSPPTLSLCLSEAHWLGVGGRAGTRNNPSYFVLFQQLSRERTSQTKPGCGDARRGCLDSTECWRLWEIILFQKWLEGVTSRFTLRNFCYSSTLEISYSTMGGRSYNTNVYTCRHDATW